MRKALIESIKKVGGWLSEEEILFLYNTAKKLPDGSTIIEIGSYKGKSTIAMAQALDDEGKPNTKIYAIDPFNSGGIKPLEGNDTYEEYLKNITQTKMDKYIVTKKDYSENVASEWKKPIDFLWIDGNHAYDSVKTDILAWKDHLKEGHLISFHDSLHLDGVTRAVKEFIFNGNDFHDIKVKGSITFAKKCRKCTKEDSLKKKFALIYYNIICLGIKLPKPIRKFGRFLVK